jgi:hypothetical protein
MGQPVVQRAECDDDGALATSLSRVDLNQESRRHDVECEVDCERTPPNNEIDVNAATAGDEAPTPSSLNGVLHPRRIICDLGYGFPKEERPRRERILAVAKQLVNVLVWQREECQRRRDKTPAVRSSDSPSTIHCGCVRLVLVDCPDEDVRLYLRKRMNELWTLSNGGSNHKIHGLDDPCQLMTAFPDSLVEFSDESLSSMMESSSSLSKSNVYLSPDSDRVLDADLPPPHPLVVGMIIDRRIQPLRSLRRAEHLKVAAARLPLHRVSDVLDHNEPLNVDCILEGIQRWYWNYDDDQATLTSCSPDPVTSDANSREHNLCHCFDDAFILALQSHQGRHPERPQHKLR